MPLSRCMARIAAIEAALRARGPGPMTQTPGAELPSSRQGGRTMSFDPERFVDGLHDYLGKALRPLHDRITVLEAEVERAKAAPFQYTGVYEPGRMYQMNQLATFNGSLWIALRTTQQKPADGDGWQLCVRAGRDGKDGR
jgi:hypothetical protein